MKKSTVLYILIVVVFSYASIIPSVVFATEINFASTNTESSQVKQDNIDKNLGRGTTETNESLVEEKATAQTKYWGTSPVTFDQNTGVISIGTGTVSGMLYDVIHQFWGTDDNISEINITGPITFLDGDASYAFAFLWAYNPKDGVIHGLNNIDTSNVHDMSHMFERTSITSLDLSNFDTSNVTNMSYMFNESKTLTNLNISGFNTSKVTDMSYMFSMVFHLESLNLSNFDTSNVINMSHMFYWVHTPLNVNNLNTSKVTDMSSMFELSSTDNLNVSNFDTSNVTNMSYMFSGDLNVLDLSNFNTSKVTDMSGMFYNMKNTELDLSNFDTSNVNNMAYMFDSCTRLVKLDISNFNTKNIISMDGMFDIANNHQFYTDHFELTLGTEFVIPEGVSLELSEVPVGQKYTGNWQNIGKGTNVQPSGNNIWSSKDFFENYNSNTDADTYVWQIKSSAEGADITAKYVNEQGNTIAPDVLLSGNVGETYTAEQKAIAGYTFKEVQGNPTGQFTDKAQSVTYVYTKDKENAINATPDDNKPSPHKEETPKTELSSSTHEVLPETGENERVMLMSVCLGLILIAFSLITSVLHFKSYRK